MPSSSSDPPHLKPGSAVEISSDDEGYRGSWFVGTVIRRSGKKGSTKFLVEYKTLFQDEAGKKPLRETLDASQLRPIQPEEKQPREFKFGDEVDAYYNDGWWEGSITEEPRDDGKFSVYFRPSKEHIDFGKESLRLHREWVNGCWKPPLEDEENGQNCEKREENLEKKEENESSGVRGGRLAGRRKRRLEGELTEERRVENNHHNVETREENEENEEKRDEIFPSDNSAVDLLSGSELNKFISELPTITDMKLDEELAADKFERGTLVEVTSNEEGFQGSWYSATIVEALGNDKYLIEYTSLRTEDDSAFLREEAETKNIRPYPPNASVEGRFKEQQEVDAFYNDGWWVGVVSKVIKRGNKYKVYFSSTKEEITFEHSDLRPHQDWFDGKWVLSSQV